MLRGGVDSKISHDFKDTKHLFSKMYHNRSRSQRLRNLIVQEVLRFQYAQKSSTNWFKIYWCVFKHILDLLGFIEITISSFPGSQSLYWDSTMLVFRFFFQTIVKTTCVRPTQNYVSISLIPTISKIPFFEFPESTFRKICLGMVYWFLRLVKVNW